MTTKTTTAVIAAIMLGVTVWSEEWPKPYSPPCTERDNVFEFTEKPRVKLLGNDRYEITFAVKARCDVTVGIIDEKGVVVRHLGAAVLGSNAPAPFQKNSLKQTLYWNGKDDLDVYHKEPGKLRLRVMLGLRPDFDKRLGGTSGKNLHGYVWGMALAEDGAYVFIKGAGSHGHVNVRKFDRNGEYVATIVPPPANMPEERLKGMGYIEYEKGVRALHGPVVHETVARNGFILPGVNGKGIASCQIALVKNRLYFTNSGSNLLAGHGQSSIMYVYTDASTDLQGLRGALLFEGAHLNTRLAPSPDGKYIYMVGAGHAVVRWEVDKNQKAKVFVGDVNKPGSDNQLLNAPCSLDVDAQGRVYVTDLSNNRIQVYGPDGKYVKSIPSDRPEVIRVHQKTGAIYVKHETRIEGKTVNRISKLASLDDPREVFHMDGYPAGVMCVDSWNPKPRLWLSGDTWESHTGGSFGKGPGLTIWEEDANGWKKISDFDEEAKKDAGDDYMGRWSGNGATDCKVICDASREILYYRNCHMFDLKTGKRMGTVKLPFATDDIIFDKRGYMHIHFNPGFYMPGVGRQDPSRAQTVKEGNEKQVSSPETPYDYGVEATGPWNQKWLGILPVKDQPGAKFFQDGIGVNMRGDVATESNIYYVPKMEDVGIALARAGIDAQLKAGQYYDGNQASRFERHIQDLKKRGEDIYCLKRRPGHPVCGGTVWTFESNGDLRKECAVTAGDIMNGVQLDEDLSVYCVTSRPRFLDNGPFLGGSGGTIGDPADKSNANPYTGTLIKTRPDTYCNVLMADAAVPLEPLPERPADLIKGSKMWVEGHEWLYAGASPIVAGGCSCPKQMLHTDWYKRVFVPEAYRHSIGVLDTAGNLVLHIGRYGNFDSGSGPGSKIPVGGDGIGAFTPRFLSGTDNYLAFDDRSERMVVLKLNYHAEETVPMPTN